VEDMRLGIELALSGTAPLFCPQAKVTSQLPTGRRASMVQRTRWEHGHLRTLLYWVPRLMIGALRKRRWDLFALALELSVPPLAFLFLLWATILSGLLGYWWSGGSALPAIVLGAGGGALACSVLAAWFRFGRECLPGRSLLAAPFYILCKLPIYLAFLLRPQRAWIRTERTLDQALPRG
jgi:cellulose synthase/poly-beta-1,6-N-acetylglucosamine synthase-like glycosyltransferase